MPPQWTVTRRKIHQENGLLFTAVVLVCARILSVDHVNMFFQLCTIKREMFIKGWKWLMLPNNNYCNFTFILHANARQYWKNPVVHWRSLKVFSAHNPLWMLLILADPWWSYLFGTVNNVITSEFLSNIISPTTERKGDALFHFSFKKVACIICIACVIYARCMRVSVKTVLWVTFSHLLLVQPEFQLLVSLDWSLFVFMNLIEEEDVALHMQLTALSS